MNKITRAQSPEPDENELKAARLRAMNEHYRQIQDERDTARKEGIALFVLVVAVAWGAWMTIQIIFGPIAI